ncbi:hypothetical protein [Coralliovum pocilloporae]|uniref:hypothetical protein n=1 Tax=Coralliovum pocilloporae TaxID=3066369 RepID=UPI0033078AF1
MTNRRRMQWSSAEDFTVKEARLDEIETNLLKVARIFCTAYADREHPHWEVAFEQACHLFGDTFGPAIGMSVMAVLSRMRTARRTGFHFNNPNCKCCRHKVTDHERHLLRVIQCIRRDDRFSAQAAALLVCEGHNTEALLDAVANLTPLLPFVQEKGTRQMVHQQVGHS